MAARIIKERNNMGRKRGLAQKLRGMTEAEWKQQLLKVHHYIQGNAPITDSKKFAHLIEDKFFHPGKTMRELCFGETGELSEGVWTNLTQSLKNRKWLRFDRPSIGEKLQWRVDDRWLFEGEEDKTGVKTPIPYTPEPEQPTPPIVAPAVDEEKILAQATTLLEEELKTIKVQSCLVVSTEHCTTEFKNVTLYDIYKVGLAQQATLKTDHFCPTPPALMETIQKLTKEEEEIELAIEETSEEDETDSPF